MENVNWQYLVPRLLFVVPVVAVLLFATREIVANARNRNRSLFALDYPRLTFFLLATWLGSEAVDIVISKFSNPIDAAVSRGVVAALPQVDYIRSDTDRAQVIATLRHEVLEAHAHIDVISWKELSRKTADPLVRQHFSTIEERLLDGAKPQIQLRRLLWNPDHLDVVEEWASVYDTIPNAEFKYYIPAPGDETPLMPCLILDKQSVHFGLGYLGTPNLDEIDITVRSPEVVEAFNKYFAYMWTAATYVKRRGRPVDIEVVKMLRASVSSDGIPTP